MYKSLERDKRPSDHGFWLLVILILLFASSCRLQKSVNKDSKKDALTETLKTKTTRVGDTLFVTVPRVTYKDTTIVTYNRETRQQGSIIYGKDGQIKAFECLSAEINEMREETRQLLSERQTKKKEEDMGFEPQHIIYAVGVLVLMILIGASFFLRMMSKQNGVISKVLERL